MRKIRILFLAEALAIANLPALGEVNALFVPDFSTGTDGWYARSARGSAISILSEGTLRISGRGAIRDSPGRSIRLQISEPYIAVGSNSKDSILRQAAMYGEIMKLLDGRADRFKAFQFCDLSDNLTCAPVNTRCCSTGTSIPGRPSGP